MTLPLQKLGKLDRMETASIDELRHEQLQRLRWSVVHAYTNVPFYRKAFDDQGLKPMDINSLEDLKGLKMRPPEGLVQQVFAVVLTYGRVYAEHGTQYAPCIHTRAMLVVGATCRPPERRSLARLDALR